MISPSTRTLLAYLGAPAAPRYGHLSYITMWGVAVCRALLLCSCIEGSARERSWANPPTLGGTRSLTFARLSRTTVIPCGQFFLSDDSLIPFEFATR